MPDTVIVREYSGVINTSSAKRLRYKTLAEDSSQLDAFFLEYLSSFNIPVAFQGRNSATSACFTAVAEFPFFIRTANYVNQEIAALTGRETGEAYQLPVLEYYWTANPAAALSFQHLIGLNVLPAEELKTLNRLVSKINALLKSFFDRREKVFISADCTFGIAEGKQMLTGSFLPGNLMVIDKQMNRTVPVPVTNSAELKHYTEMLLEAIRS